jgi:predicted RNase H-like HicB family nuclease
MRARHTFEVHYELDETGWWLATIPKVPGCHTQGRTIEQAENRIREALALFVSAATAAKATLEADVQLPSAAKRALISALEKRAEADAIAVESQAATRSATLALSQVGLSLRDIGRLLGVTRQRAHQLLGD